RQQQIPAAQLFVCSWLPLITDSDIRDQAFGDQDDSLLGALFWHAASNERLKGCSVNSRLVLLVSFPGLGFRLDAGLLICLTLALGGCGLLGCLDAVLLGLFGGDALTLN